TAVKDTRAVYQMTGKLGPYAIKGEIEATYDGVIDYDYTLTLQAEEPTEAEAE
ncbi:MAG: hypothetical protein GY884_29595, partial [Proteobacteria bacterium]|nr:hypothetical protein [Pseudomonadota bacterium]